MYKKFLAGVLTVSMAFCLAACGGSDTKKEAKLETVKVSENESTGPYKAADEKIAVDMGEVKLANVKDVIVYEDDVKVTKQAYKDTVKNILSQNATTKTVEKGEVKKDSVVVVDYEGKIEVDGKKVAFDGGTAQDANINMATDEGQYIEGFVSCLKGKKVGDKFTEKLKFPKSYDKTTKINNKDVKLAGQTVWFTFTVKSLQVTETPELDDKFVTKNFGAYGVKTVDAFKDYAYKQMRISNVVNSGWQDYISSCEVVAYNSEKKAEQIKKYNEQYEQQLKTNYQCSLKDYLEACSMSQKDWDKQVEESVLSDMKNRMIIQAVAKAYKLELTDEVYKKEASTMAESMTQKVSDLEKQYGKEEVEYAILYQKVQEYFANNVTVKEGSAPTTEAPTTEAVETTKEK
ncbi:MAG: FKBP-type peptidyl-prolyl cis-trans isomerase [Eubacterium sp.]|nr:FKBP-type peptidyl-prolyl cis-trans isomerase [Eubacterium sp.]